MSKPNMAVDLGGIRMKNPINTASGTFGYGQQFEAFMDVSRLGAITTKGCSAVPWEGNAAPRMCETVSGMMNSVGLQNPGIPAFLDEYGDYLRGLSAKGTAVICQVVGHSVDEYVQALELYEQGADFAAGFEINISCPNVEKGGAAMGATPQAAAELMRALRPRSSRPLVVKMAPSNVPEIARALEAEGANALSLINTIPAMAIDVHTRRSRLVRPTAGLSGPAIHPVAVRCVWEAAQAVDIPICGIGGITTGEDAAEMILAGACCVSVGTSNLYDPASALRILAELEAWVESQGVDDINRLIGAFEC